eukprot:CAMPEP_0119038858 /NCGR_PEP_ID=MMETSP1177-20130426/8024_1 /TAXON_ID=2985 /ORGANISM="Ochromonas sp, Strain CCMP1899" /LENGTH=78 /DNA_ID=CAMNT_0007001971 /DNA_START=25 /DNA_END=261 /DNA_ORIENTATION=-
MTRGNQRDEARLKNAKDAAGKGVAKTGSVLLRREADSNALAEKVAKKKADAEAVARGDIIPVAKRIPASIQKKDGGKK